MATMSTEARDAFLRETRIGTLVTMNPDGGPTAVPVWYDWDGGSVRLFTSRRSGKVRRIAADPRAALSVAEPVGVPEAWVTVEGAATVEAQGGMELARELAGRYYTPEQAAQAVAAWEGQAEQWVVIRITPGRIRSSAPE